MYLDTWIENARSNTHHLVPRLQWSFPIRVRAQCSHLCRWSQPDKLCLQHTLAGNEIDLHRIQARTADSETELKISLWKSRFCTAISEREAYIEKVVLRSKNEAGSYNSRIGAGGEYGRFSESFRSYIRYLAFWVGSNSAHMNQLCTHIPSCFGDIFCTFPLYIFEVFDAAMHDADKRYDYLGIHKSWNQGIWVHDINWNRWQKDIVRDDALQGRVHLLWLSGRYLYTPCQRGVRPNMCQRFGDMWALREFICYCNIQVNKTSVHLPKNPAPQMTIFCTILTRDEVDLICLRFCYKDVRAV